MSVCVCVCVLQLLDRTKILKWLLTRMRVREFDSNKQEASELMAILIQGSEVNQKRSVTLLENTHTCTDAPTTQ